MLALSEFSPNTWLESVPQSNGTINGGIPTILPSSIINVTSVSNFGPGIGVVTTAIVTGIAPPLPVIVNADFSCWCPTLGAYVRPEDTNLMTKLSE